MIKILLLILGGLLAFVILLLLLVLFLPASVRLCLRGEDFSCRIGLGPISFQIWPLKQKKPRKQKKKQREHKEEKRAPDPPQAEKTAPQAPKAEAAPQKEPTAQKKPPSKNRASKNPLKKGLQGISFSDITLAQWMDYLHLAVEAMGRICRAIVIRRFKVHFTIATEDAAKTAMLFGASAAAVNLTLPWVEERIRIKKKDVFVQAAFDQTKPYIEADILVTAILFKFLIAGLRIFKKFKILQSQNNSKAV